MADGSLLSLRWNNHNSHFKATLSQLQQKELYSDATIACEEHFYPVHKFVLSTCSDYFMSIFEQTPCKHPVIVLKGVSSKDITHLLSYMYDGEVSVTQADLPNLIKAAETLQIKGLAAPDDPPLSPSCTESYKKVDSNAQSRSYKRRRIEESFPTTDDRYNDIKKEVEDADTDQSGQDSSPPHPIGESAEFVQSFSATDLKTQLDAIQQESDFQMKEKIEPFEISLSNESANSNISPHESGAWPTFDFSNIPHHDNRIPSTSNTFLDQSHTSHERSNVSPHPNRGALPPLHPCAVCQKKFKSKADVVRHMRTHTGEKPFKCHLCDYKSALKGNLKSHIVSLHPQYHTFNS